MYRRLEEHNGQRARFLPLKPWRQATFSSSSRRDHKICGKATERNEEDRLEICRL